ncbi:unnamed protein product [Linum trigynum]|uniref:Uncharacterized protein n=1 Tax=Linum trigynum TaxID=586398 RepID=A0AAV2ECM7_9ROSI
MSNKAYLICIHYLLTKIIPSIINQSINASTKKVVYVTPSNSPYASTAASPSLASFELISASTRCMSNLYSSNGPNAVRLMILLHDDPTTAVRLITVESRRRSHG